jgi:hypothetical protein
MDRDDGVDQAEQAARQHRDAEPDPRIAGRGSDREAGDGADQHHPLDAQVEHAGSFGEDLADRGEQQDRAARNPGREDQRQVDHVGAAMVARRPTTTR